MMYRRCRYDVAHFIRNDAMFAIKCGEATHHLPKANIIKKSSFDKLTKEDFLAEAVGFEPTIPGGIPDFESGPL